MKSWFFHTPLHSTPPLGVLVGVLPSRLMWTKIEWSGYPLVKKSEDMCNHFDRIPACDRQTDRRTDGQTDRRTSCHGMIRAMHISRAIKTNEPISMPVVRGVRRSKFTVRRGRRQIWRPGGGIILDSLGRVAFLIRFCVVAVTLYRIHCVLNKRSK